MQWASDKHLLRPPNSLRRRPDKESPPLSICYEKFWESDLRIRIGRCDTRIAYVLRAVEDLQTASSRRSSSSADQSASLDRASV